MLRYTRWLLLVAAALLVLPVWAGDAASRHTPEYLVAVPASPQEKSAGVAPEVIVANPEPNVTPLEVTDENLYNRAYRRVMGSLRMYDSPGGSLIEDLGQGFNFVTAGGSQNGFSFIGGNRWVPTELLSNRVNVSRFAGVLLPEETLPFTAAWVVQKVRPSEHPGEAEAPSNPVLERYTRVNLFSTVDLEGYRWYQVGERQWIHQYNVSKIIPVARPAEVQAHKWVSIDLYEQNLIAYEGDRPVFATLISSGLPNFATPEGVFHVYLRADRIVMTGLRGRPEFYYLMDVPANMFFKDDIALHGAYWHDRFGFRTSRGCVNMTLADSQWLYQWSADEMTETPDGMRGMGVYVYSSGEYR
ncbi:MAG: L,D-transpeptidase [Anaerolineae bacterium]|nr:L,D-transpeptidase [Anaerolineae bacterium]